MLFSQLWPVTNGGGQGGAGGTARVRQEVQVYSPGTGVVPATHNVPF